MNTQPKIPTIIRFPGRKRGGRPSTSMPFLEAADVESLALPLTKSRSRSKTPTEIVNDTQSDVTNRHATRLKQRSSQSSNASVESPGIVVMPAVEGDAKMPLLNTNRKESSLLGSRSSWRTCCIAPGCDGGGGSAATYCFPADSQERARWCSALGLTPEKTPRFARLCARHFASGDLVERRRGHVTLRQGAVPSLEATSTGEAGVYDDEDDDAADVKPASKRRRPSPTSTRNKTKKPSKFAPMNTKPVYGESASIDKCKVIDRNYYYVMTQQRKEEKQFNSLASPDCLPKLTPGQSPSHCLPRHEEKADSEESVDQTSLMPLTESIMDAVNKAPSSVDAFASINDLLKHAMSGGIVCEPNDRHSASRDRITSSPASSASHCLNINCRQLASRVQLLRREKEKLTRILDQARLSLMAAERRSEMHMEVNETCASCADGRLIALHDATLKRAKMLRRLVAERFGPEALSIIPLDSD